MNIIPRCKHGPFCTGGPMHFPLFPENSFEVWLMRFFPPPPHPYDVLHNGPASADAAKDKE